jgi:catechol 2,3-dioxygenase-like lactoylglutathione lyase family enzyme
VCYRQWREREPREIGMVLYVTVGSNDIARTMRFYDAALPVLGFECRVARDDEAGYGQRGDDRTRFWVVKPHDKRAASIGNGSMVALEAPNRAAVDAFHVAALSAGGTDEGAPGLRPYHATFYACYVRDPDGNKISAVCEAAED